MREWFSINSSLLVFAAVVTPLHAQTSTEKVNVRAIQFNRDIRPILSENCFQCHGPDAAHREADLRLDLREAAIEKRDSGAAIVPGDANASHLITRILSTDPDAKMPPEKSGRKLTAAQIDLLKEWIAQEANYEAHWSFVTPKSPSIPTVKKSGLAARPDRSLHSQQDRRAKPKTLARSATGNLAASSYARSGGTSAVASRPAKLPRRPISRCL